MKAETLLHLLIVSNVKYALLLVSNLFTSYDDVHTLEFIMNYTCHMGINENKPYREKGLKMLLIFFYFSNVYKSLFF